MRTELIRKQFAEAGQDFDSAEAEAALRQAQGVLSVHRHNQSPDAENFGSPVPAFCRGEVYQTESAFVDSSGDRRKVLVNKNGPLIKRTTVREVQLGPNTWAVVEAR